MSLKYVGETALQENIVKTKEHVESVRATLDAAKQDKIELATMPQASEDNLGLVVIYTGSTTSTYTHGYMYECVSDGETPATYSWEQLTSDVKIDNTTIVKDAYTGELSAALATTHSLGIVKGGSGTMIGDYGEINVYQRLAEGGVGDPGSRVSLIYYDSGFRLNLVDSGDYKKGGIYELQINAVTPVGTENPNEEGWYEYDGSSWDYREYFLTEDTTVDSEKTYYTIAWEIVSANSQEFNTDDFEIENNVVSLDVTQRSFTGTQAEWDALTLTEKTSYGIVNITDDEKADSKQWFANQFVLSEPEAITLTNNEITAPYDGIFTFVWAGVNASSLKTIYINDVEVTHLHMTNYGGGSASTSYSVQANKGDVVKITSGHLSQSKAQYYKLRDYSLR